MSSPTPADQKVRAYLKRQLARNPWEESGTIVAERSRALRLKPRATPSTAVGSGEERQRLRAELDALRGLAFSAPLPKLKERLAKLQLDDYPDLRAAADRLRTILASRDVLPALTQHRDFNADFLACFKEVLVSPARDTAVLRERVLNSFGKRKLRRPGVKMIRLLEKEAPALCQLERPWLDALTKQKSKAAGPVAGGAAEQRGWDWRWAFVAMFLIAPLMRQLGRESDDKKPNYQPPSATIPETLVPPGASLRSDPEADRLRRQREREARRASADAARQRLLEHAESPWPEDFDSPFTSRQRRGSSALRAGRPASQSGTASSSDSSPAGSISVSIGSSDGVRHWKFKFAPTPPDTATGLFAPLEETVTLEFENPSPMVETMLEGIKAAISGKDIEQRPSVTADDFGRRRHGQMWERYEADRLQQLQVLRDVHEIHLAHPPTAAASGTGQNATPSIQPSRENRAESYLSRPTGGSPHMSFPKPRFATPPAAPRGSPFDSDEELENPWDDQ